MTKKDLDEALSYYPQIAEQIKEVAGNRANKVKKRNEIQKKAAAEGASASDAAAAAAKGTSDMEDEGKKEPKSGLVVSKSAAKFDPKQPEQVEIIGLSAIKCIHVFVYICWYVYTYVCSQISKNITGVLNMRVFLYHWERVLYCISK